MNFGLPEMLIIFILALLLFGPRKLPEIGRTVGRAMAEFRRASDELKTSLIQEVEMEENTGIRELKEDLSQIRRDLDDASKSLTDFDDIKKDLKG
ncbi:MAG: twin-arginine translocase TatA/TatE family subunit [Acidobacteria bacterium]|nr:twin-arginine translocase TatA/TatE family subunit [Acidobacteriota bacterium]